MRLGWIFKKKIHTRVRISSSADYKKHKERAREIVHSRLMYWNTVYKCTYNRVTIRNQRSRWGSCSSRGNLNFNYRLVFLPNELVDYIIVHELCHLIELNHSSDFWKQVSYTIPDYNLRKRLLQTFPVYTISTQAQLR